MSVIAEAENGFVCLGEASFNNIFMYTCIEYI